MHRWHLDGSGCCVDLGPGHQLVDAGLRPGVDELGQRVGQPRVWVYAVEFACLDRRGDGRPVGAALVTASEQGILPVEREASALSPGAPGTLTVVFHNATIVAARRLTHCETLAQQDSNSNMLNSKRCAAGTLTAQAASAFA